MIVTQDQQLIRIDNSWTMNPEVGLLSKTEWEGSCLGSESTLHQLAPYIGKMKSTMAKALIREYSHQGDLVLDPFVGSGVVALECLIAGRGIIAVDINPYAILLTKAKLEAPGTLVEAISKATHYLQKAKSFIRHVSMNDIPDWVKEFFHPETLAEIVSLNSLLIENREHFLQACLLGILHHQRPGFLSYPASHLIPYLRTQKFPREVYPTAYEYRAVEPRLLAKIRRVYRRFPETNKNLTRVCLLRDAAKLDLEPESIDAVITSPPYMNTLDYARDNRLRLWFLGITQHDNYDRRANTKVKFIKLMGESLSRIRTALRTGGKCVLVVGEISRSRTVTNIAEIIADMAISNVGGFSKEDILVDSIPDIRRARKEGRCTKREWILVLGKG